MTMKRIAAFALLLSIIFTLCSCSVPEQCKYENYQKAVAEEETVTACIYSESTDSTVTDEIYDLNVNDEFLSFLKGEFSPADDYSIGTKILSVTVSMQYELCLFDNGYAMIYYGFTNVFQGDREYYHYKLNADKNELLDYIRDNGTIKNMEEEK